MCKDVDSVIGNNSLKIRNNKASEGIFRNLSEKDFSQSIGALRVATNNLLRKEIDKFDYNKLEQDTKRIGEITSLLGVQERIFDRFSAYALR